MTTTIKDPALQWAADRAKMPYDRFVTGLTDTAIQRIHNAYQSRYVYDAKDLSSAPQFATVPHLR